ncbi:2-amino-4-hydroxy-6-hydroxymethyldihydropteridine diphosphokinase [bacterium]|nr:2-amino-4-hydroxy-6-hydroxymethyldihydropteridine diphosphokinase [bacterium]
MTRTWIGLGSNQGDRADQIATALREVDALKRSRVVCVSSLYETAPIGKTDQPFFLNVVAEVETDRDPHGLLRDLLAIEQRMGRSRTVRWGPRTIDLDVLIFGDISEASDDLTIPHPRLAERAFVLVPLVEIAPDVLVPGEERTPAQLLGTLSREAGDAVRAGDPPWPDRRGATCRGRTT